MLFFIRSISILIISAVFTFPLNVIASVANTLTYQGYLTNASGTPINGSTNITVNLYNTDTGGSSLWSQSGSVNVVDGRYAIVLDGSGGNPFPAGLFQQQTYAGVTVESDSEMTPRRMITSMPSALESENASMLEGMSASQIVDAAVNAVRSPISSLPFSISQSGSYYLTQNLDGSAGGGIDVNVDNVTIDLMGFTIDGGGFNDFGVDLSNQSAVTIKNGTIQNFGMTGIYENTNSLVDTNSNVISYVNVINNGTTSGAATLNGGIYLPGRNNRIENCIVINSGGGGIYSGDNSIILNNTVEDSFVWGILAGVGSSLINNTLSGSGNNATYGIHGLAGSTLINNTVRQNQSGYGISAGPFSTIINNTAASNQHWGIYGEGGNTIIGNTASGNNLSETNGQGGILVGGNSLVESNSASDNQHTGIRVDGSNNTIRNNHASSSGNINGGGSADGFCFEIDDTSNLFIGNTAANCTTDYGGAGWPTTVNRENDAI